MNFILNLLRFLPTALGFIGRFLISVFCGISASLIWLWHYLKKDVIPEPKKAIFRAFVWGMIITFPVIIIEICASKLIKQEINPFLYWFLVIAFTEEIFKYLIVRGKILRTKEVDEPVDVMIYMIVAALGFAGLENILYLLPTVEKALPFLETFKITLIESLARFLGATFLHALCSGSVGYFIALGIFQTKKRLKLISAGLGMAIFLHGLYNFAIIEIEDIFLKVLIPLAILIGLAIFLTFGFRRLQKMKSVCKV